jgi:hypothetical protein
MRNAVALVEELEEALYGGWMFRTGDSDERLTIKDMTPGIRRSLVSKYRNIPEQAAAIMPIIDAMLAERDIDAMLERGASAGSAQLSRIRRFRSVLECVFVDTRFCRDHGHRPHSHCGHRRCLPQGEGAEGGR